ncbi:unnamed protein product [Mytilus edulis]|uniref:malate synthase n=1 Tax=Mytilus edulis TaxID=6550 RepID=A0A8S3TZW4_MYTED|nr:unnamed protein product [Mytilus edulis]
MDRLKIIKNHLLVKGREPCIATKLCSFDSSQDCLHLKSGLQKLGLTNIEVSSPPVNYEHYYRTLLTPEAVKFVADLVNTFDNDVEGIFQERQRRKLLLDSTGGLPDFSKKSAILHGNWKVRPVPQRLQCRHVDLGDVSPSNTSHFVESLKTTAQGIQTDFDDGHCPTWKNQLLGLYNIYQFVHGNIAGVPAVDKAPVLMLRPRAWNMIEHNLLIEGSNEARLWNKIFDYTERKLDLPHGCIKACVLIENILASFEMEEILYELKDHSAGLNCGIWDYSASFINKFGHRKEFVLPDRNKYVSMDRHFLKSYMDLVVKICHSHGAHATGGMAAPILPNGTTSGTVFQQIVDKVKGGKVKEIQAGVDGFMVYDLRLLQPMQQDLAGSCKGHVCTVSEICIPQSQTYTCVLLLEVFAEWRTRKGYLVSQNKGTGQSTPFDCHNVVVCKAGAGVDGIKEYNNMFHTNYELEPFWLSAHKMLIHVGTSYTSQMELCGQFIGPAVTGQVIAILCNTLPEGHVVKLTSVNTASEVFHLSEVEVYAVYAIVDIE